MSYPARRIFRFLQIGFKKKTRDECFSGWVRDLVPYEIWFRIQPNILPFCRLQKIRVPYPPMGYMIPRLLVETMQLMLFLRKNQRYRIVGHNEITLTANSFLYIYRQSWQSLSMFVECLPMCWNLNSSIQDYRTSSLCLDLLIPFLTISKHGWNWWYHPSSAVPLFPGINPGAISQPEGASPCSKPVLLNGCLTGISLTGVDLVEDFFYLLIDESFISRISPEIGFNGWYGWLMIVGDCPISSGLSSCMNWESLFTNQYIVLVVEWNAREVETCLNAVQVWSMTEQLG